jgi:Adenylate and Guanylate cyclase catalytic domain
VRQLPSGTVTLLFTDIEGPTRLLHELGDRYADVLAEHRSVLRDAFSRNGGVEVDTQGDAFFVAFARAADAVAAADDAQAALADGPVSVRIGVHTGEPVVTEEGYVGIDVHRAARIMGAAHGGQVLVSEPTARLLESASLRDLGEHRLKDLSAPQRLFQLGSGDFPPLRTLYRTNLPIQATPLVGREQELDEAAELIRTRRLLTLIGPGGSGKTRLAVQLAADAIEQFPDGVFWVPLQALRDPALVERAIGASLEADDGLSDHVGSKRLLVLVDNFEQVIEAAPVVASLLAATPNAKVLVTSREPLQIEFGAPLSRGAVARRRRDDSVRGACGRRRSRVPDQRGSLRDLSTARWAPARDRACRGPRCAARAGRASEPPRPEVAAPRVALARCPDEAADIARGLRDRAGRIFGVGLLAWVAAERGLRERAGRLRGAVEHVLEVVGPEFDRGRAEGGAMTLDDAVELALAGLP